MFKCSCISVQQCETTGQLEQTLALLKQEEAFPVTPAETGTG